MQPDFLPTAITRRWLKLGVALLSLGILLPDSVLAGDKLNIGSAKIQTQPGQEDKVNDPLTLEKLHQTNLRNGISIQPMNRGRSRGALTKFEKRLRNERDERKNWALLAPGELQARDEQEYDFGVREYSVDKRTEDSGQRDYTFYGIGKEERQGNTSTQQVNRNDQPQRKKAEGRLNQPTEDQESFAYERPEDTTRDAPKRGLHMSEELELRGLLDTTSDSLGPNPNLLGNKQFIRSDHRPKGMTDSLHDQRMTTFRQLINAETAISPLQDPSREEPTHLSKSTLAPAPNNSLRAAPRSFGQQSFYVAPNRNLPGSAFNLPESPSTLQNGAQRRDLFRNPTSFSQPDSSPSRPNSFGFEPTKRRF